MNGGSGLQKQTLPTFLPAIGLRLTPLPVDKFAFYVVLFLLCHISAQTNMDGEVFTSKCSTGRTWKYNMARPSLLIRAGAKTHPLAYSESLLLKWIPLVPFSIEDKSQPLPTLQRTYGDIWMDGLHHMPVPNRSESNTNRCAADLQINIYNDE